MPAAPVPANEDDRLAALLAHGILDTGEELGLNGLALEAACLFDAPIALVSLVDRDRQWFKARVGVELRESSRAVSFCAYGLLDGRTLLVEDARRDARFSDNPLVTGAPGIRFYAGVPLIDPAGHRLGSLCAIDLRPRPRPDDAVLRKLEWLADMAARQIAL